MLGVQLMSKEKRQKRSDAVILNIASLVGLDPFHLMPIYSASKHAIVGFSRAYSVNTSFHLFISVDFVNSFSIAFQHDTYYQKNCVKIVILCPGATTTRFVRQFAGNLIVPNENKALEALRCVPKQRFDE